MYLGRRHKCTYVHTHTHTVSIDTHTCRLNKCFSFSKSLSICRDFAFCSNSSWLRPGLQNNKLTTFEQQADIASKQFFPIALFSTKNLCLEHLYRWYTTYVCMWLVYVCACFLVCNYYFFFFTFAFKKYFFLTALFISDCHFYQISSTISDFSLFRFMRFLHLFCYIYYLRKAIKLFWLIKILHTKDLFSICRNPIGSISIHWDFDNRNCKAVTNTI